MKILNKVKKGLIAVGALLVAFPKKVFANAESGEILTQALYGPYNPNPSTDNNMLWEIVRVCAIPLVVVIGLIIYFKKSKSSTKKKILITSLIVLIAVIVYIVLLQNT